MEEVMIDYSSRSGGLIVLAVSTWLAGFIHSQA
jgi:hypothetical protein